MGDWECDCDQLMPGETSIQHYDNCRVELMKRNEQYWTKYPKLCFRSPAGHIVLQNKHILNLERDNLYHLALSTDDDLPNMFGDIKFVCMGGTEARMKTFALYMSQILNETVSENLTEKSQRYAMYKVGSVLSVSHGIGSPSMTILLQEVIKLLHYAKAKNPIIIRIGTSGGLGIAEGSVVVSTFGMNGLMKKSYDLPILGELVSRTALFDRRLAQEISSMSTPEDGFQTICGGTMAADDFYLGQARMDGPFCRHEEADKLWFLNRLRQLGVRNVEMEANAFAALTREAAVRAADVCVTMIDRLKGDQVTTPKELAKDYQKRPMIVVGRFIKRVLDYSTE